MKKEIYLLIRNNITIRTAIAEYFKITDSTAYGLAYRQRPKLNNGTVIEIIKFHTGKTIDQILTKEELSFVK